MAKTRQQTSRIQDLGGLLNALYPAQFAEDWDNVGLQVGDPLARVERVLVCLDPTREALAQASELKVQAIISHHPLIFKPLRQLTPTNTTGRLVWEAVRDGIAIFAVHTNLDRARPGLNDWLADRLQLQTCQPLQLGQAGELTKLVVFVPEGHQDQVSEALFAAGAGRIGNYDRCSFRSAGTGTFRGGAGTEPFLGRPGETEQADELRLETIVAREHLARVTRALLKSHPYEEVAFDLIPLENQRGDIGLGRIGPLAEATTLAAFAGQVKQALGCQTLRWTGQADQRVAKVALCGGSGASLLQEAVRQGADVLVTGDVKYHDARSALEQGIGLVDAGHFATEQLMVAGLTGALSQAAEERGLPLEFIAMNREADPFQTL